MEADILWLFNPLIAFEIVCHFFVDPTPLQTPKCVYTHDYITFL